MEEEDVEKKDEDSKREEEEEVGKNGKGDKVMIPFEPFFPKSLK